MQSINPCFVHKILTVRTNALFLLVSYHEKAAIKKGSVHGRVLYSQKKYTLHSTIGPRGYYKVQLLENKANNA